ncbi:lipocalin-like domain-containing protein [Kaistella palustris]|uniref:lipocalin family protein n=1 Tax=Kaistella palustris TaxID=493376 RepID=UPI000482E363|nr:lipocalin family protein [Kaistella palustris]
MKPKANQFYSRSCMSLYQKILYLPLLLLMMFFTVSSCRSDDNSDEQQTATENLLGIWQPYRFNQTATLNSGTYNQTTDYTICQQKSRIYFSENNMGSTKLYGEENGNCVMQSNDNFTFSYDAQTKALTITNSDGTTQTGTVIRLTESELVYELTGTYDFQGQTNVAVKTTIYARKTKD